ncbi:hypothetical protein C9374_005089 [Naegleria lovaniensis]|uniref:D-lactate dehydrogenase n=1 Tax=Naegleria lovaniensis TaxID=51637 RepID=A0AA88GNU9_NAELO|nr:uncharacterized protein C9374_005089 [Naegleria lovaniensis]KAG2382509.1 hypothetical protein C9374_005089 [Naegleria lovaniensis]
MNTKTIASFSSKPFVERSFGPLNPLIYTKFCRDDHFLKEYYQPLLESKSSSLQDSIQWNPSKFLPNYSNLERSGPFHLKFIDARLTESTLGLAEGCDYITVFVNDNVNRNVLKILHSHFGVKCVALRSAGYNNVDIAAATEYGIKVCRVPEYSPGATADFTIAMIMALNRKIHRAFQRIKDGEFSLEGLMGFDMNTKVYGVIGGSGKIGKLVCKCLRMGFGARVMVYDSIQDPDLIKMGIEFVESMDDLYAQADVITLHCPLIKGVTEHMINANSIKKMKKGVMIVNAARGGLIVTEHVIDGLKSGQIGSLGLDVYEFEHDLFFEDRREQIITDDTFMRLLTFPNVIVTPHQAFFTNEAINNIAQTTLESLYSFEVSGHCFITPSVCLN